MVDARKYCVNMRGKQGDRVWSRVVRQEMIKCLCENSLMYFHFISLSTFFQGKGVGSLFRFAQEMHSSVLIYGYITFGINGTQYKFECEIQLYKIAHHNLFLEAETIIRVK